MIETEESKWTKWKRNGRLSFIVWVLGILIYATFKLAKIPAPELDALIAALTGLLVANLTIGKGDNDK